MHIRNHFSITKTSPCRPTDRPIRGLLTCRLTYGLLWFLTTYQIERQKIKSDINKEINEPSCKTVKRKQKKMRYQKKKKEKKTQSQYTLTHTHSVAYESNEWMCKKLWHRRGQLEIDATRLVADRSRRSSRQPGSGAPSRSLSYPTLPLTPSLSSSLRQRNATHRSAIFKLLRGLVFWDIWHVNVAHTHTHTRTHTHTWSVATAPLNARKEVRCAA